MSNNYLLKEGNFLEKINVFKGNIISFSFGSFYMDIINGSLCIFRIKEEIDDIKKLEQDKINTKTKYICEVGAKLFEYRKSINNLLTFSKRGSMEEYRKLCAFNRNLIENLKDLYKNAPVIGVKMNMNKQFFDFKPNETIQIDGFNYTWVVTRTRDLNMKEENTNFIKDIILDFSKYPSYNSLSNTIAGQ